ncbi:MAG: MATE family efflux transporter [Clostridiales bacterium]|nr:MATE family efflux transporter [Clostridiales bacterium]
MRQRNLTEGNITKNLLFFAFPMMAGNLLQQCYNIADTLIVSRFLGANALAAVGSSYTLMTFLTSILLGMCMGSGAAFSIWYGQKDRKRLKEGMVHAFGLIAAVTIVLNVLVFAGLPLILRLLQVPTEVTPYMEEYLKIIFAGISATFLYNYYAALLRAIGNSVVPLVFLGVSAVLNIILDFLFVFTFQRGVGGAAEATVIAQFVSGIGIAFYTQKYFPELRVSLKEIHFKGKMLNEIAGFSFLTCMQQSIMNFGILMVQGLVNSFGPVVMAAFAAAVKIDSFAYMPVQDFGNAFSTFIAQNYGAKKFERIQKGIKSAVMTSVLFCAVISGAVFIFAESLMKIFVSGAEKEIISVGVEYLRIEGSFYFGIGILFLLYGLYRAVKLPGMSVVLTILSLGTRVALAYGLSAIPMIGVRGIWAAVPIGWILADAVGVIYYIKNKGKIEKALGGKTC